MREQPDLSSAQIKDCLFHDYGLHAAEVALLPQSGDFTTAIYRVITQDNISYFIKVKRGVFQEIPPQVQDFLFEIAIRAIIPPLRTKSHQLWVQLEAFQVIVYPFVEGHNAFEVDLTERQWVEFGAVLKAIHTASVPANLSKQMKQETYTPFWREKAKELLERVKKETYQETIAARYAGFLVEKAEEIRHIVQMAERLSVVLQTQNPPFVLCHSDIHAGNLLIDANSRLFLVDWDEPILAAKERDLMFIGGGVGSVWGSPREEALFYEGYGPAEINYVALAYYRFERIVQDIAEWGERVLLTEQGGQARERWLQGLKRWFQPNDVVAMAYQAEKNLPSNMRFQEA